MPLCTVWRWCTLCLFCFFFSSRRRHTRWTGDWSSDVALPISGSAGATPVQNVGAYGAEVADTIRRVRLLDRRSGEARWVPPEALEFGYRTSVLRHSRAAIVLEVEFALNADGLSAPLRYGELATALGARSE